MNNVTDPRGYLVILFDNISSKVLKYKSGGTCFILCQVFLVKAYYNKYYISTKRTCFSMKVLYCKMKFHFLIEKTIFSSKPLLVPQHEWYQQCKSMVYRNTFLRRQLNLNLFLWSFLFLHNLQNLYTTLTRQQCKAILIAV